ncbi:1-acyl-sn-glycerol-3-phosphate acyltransferase [Leptospira wolffii]|uniref:1-acyl-sn-glycerol-3-phosphate acyltransferase n=1 Tax=Leptospira wolffii TaxID=409998 RepID=A0A2M9ZC62_9LEPT|nr:1-acyl-sn-glycerol-3-phosphate acyltransferase [Leptospira wolffii]EPG65836.1 acyltransferase [Leptospira wolffii serovar Khorat str. Khorat-H2]PJZ66031.1 1-acyl-sn-glycerol-3-phosphate acyltransferase [Leptospira wolffii]TGK59241.1 1-acyl-sn-glycerol-3-phosphate acyltransferase [Leptospira wolffii]TGK71074.1 1-acyl-sn-glycerol-3-phosphate acyltransferase [Leptospira wolffii]TGK71378.1 1-acyl-sn-glycerol-3-phosphate acyltransferase [Leptospira wolffii]
MNGAEKEEKRTNNGTKPVFTTKFYDVMIGMVYRFRGILFDSLEEYFPAENPKQILEAPYPSVLMANHVWEGDVPALSAVYRHIHPSIKFAIPAREDILGKDFLVKEFKPKGFLKFIFKIIDKSMIIPKYLDYIGCVPIKRPFRDNARELLKKGALREMVEQEWSYLSDRISEGRNLFLFPEGVFNQDGYMSQIKKGVYFLRSKFKEINFTSFTLTYDYFSSKKTELHIGYGKAFPIPENTDADKVAGIVKERLGAGYAVTAGNLTSYVLLKFEGKGAESKEKLLSLIKSLASTIRTKHPEIYVSGKFSSEKLAEAFDSFLEKAKRLGFIQHNGQEVRFLEKLFQPPKDLHNLKKKNLVLYHKNQLTYHFAKLDAAWASLAKA